jgi:hypothetical protein
MIFDTALRQPGLFRTPLNGRIVTPSDTDELSLDLQFAADRTLTARRGPTPTFTRASTATFVGSDGLIQSAAINTPRFDHDPVTLASRGLLIEESRTNLVINSDDFSLAFATERASIDPNITTAPNGSTTADKLVEDTTSSNSHRLTRQFNLSAIPYTFSVFAKASERSWIRMTLFDGTTGRQVWFDVSAGVIGTQSGAIGQIVSFGNGWWRCSITATGLAFISSQANIALATADNISSYTGDGTSGLFLWGAQLEAGSFPTSYIPTTTTALTRSADVCSYSDVSGFYNPAAGTLVGDLILYTPAPSPSPELFRFGSGNDRIQLGTTNVVTQAIRPFIISGGVTTYDSTQGTTVAGTRRKVALAFATNDAISCLNGTLGTQDSSVTIPVSISTATIGASAFTGHIASLQHYRKRLSNVKLQALTT